MFDIIADSACDFTPEMAQKIGVEIVPFYVSLDGEHSLSRTTPLMLCTATTLFIIILHRKMC